MANVVTVGKVHPAVVISREDPKSPRAISICVPLTTQLRQSPYEVAVGKLRFPDRPSWANVQALSAIANETFLRRLGTSTPKQLEEIQSALRFALELE